jgi:hypothetical protein
MSQSKPEKEPGAQPPFAKRFKEFTKRTFLEVDTTDPNFQEAFRALMDTVAAESQVRKPPINPEVEARMARSVDAIYDQLGARAIYPIMYGGDEQVQLYIPPEMPDISHGWE